MMPRPSRRDLIRLGLAAGAGGLLLPRRAAAAPVSGADRRFLFLIAWGGWDPTHLFAPVFDHPWAELEDDAVPATVAGLPIVDHPDRPSVRAFFETWGDRCAFLNGFEVRSITHERCARLLLTGRADAGGEDWPALLGAGARPDLPLSTLVCSGPSYTSALTSGVVRVGAQGQLTDLLTGEALAVSAPGLPTLGDDATAALDAALEARLGRLAGTSPFADRMDTAHAHLAALADDARLLDPTVPAFDNCEGVFDELATAVAALGSGKTRAAVVTYSGWCGQTFDQHSDMPMQSRNFEELFQHLQWTVDELALTPGRAGGSLLDETTVVVLSEMGRHPIINAQGGKDHWTFTSAMLVGSGVRGGTVVGGYDDEFMGHPVDLATGEVRSDGVGLLPQHLGATLLALADVDPAEHIDDADPVEALLS